MGTRVLLVIAALLALTVPGGLNAATAGPAGGNTLVYAHGLEADSLDPNNYQSGGSEVTLIHIFDRLVEYRVSSEGRISTVPRLATSWRVSPDGMSWTFRLRQGVKFHDGTPFDSEAVKFTFERIIDRANGFRSYGAFAPILDKIEAPDPQTVIITTKRPYGALLDLLAISAASIVSPAAVKKYGNRDFMRNPVGTGPFAFKTWVRDDHIDLVANKAYWDGAPRLDRLIIRPIIEPSPKSLALETGEVHAIAAVPVDDLERLGRHKDIKILRVSSARIRTIGINTLQKPLDDKRVRQALNYAIDKDGMVKNLLKGTKVVNDSPLPRMTWGYLKVGAYPYDPARAAALLREAGVETPITLHFLALKQARDPGLMDSLQLIREQLRAVGINTTYEETDIAAYLAILDKPPDDARKSRVHIYAQGYGPRLDADE